MPRESRWLIKTSLLYLALALASGLVMAIVRLTGHSEIGAMLVTPTLHLLTVGWLTQLIFGVMFWLFPRHGRERPYGYRKMVWLAYPLLNTGLLTRAVTEPFTAGTSLGQWFLSASALLQWLGALIFIVYIWPRVKRK